jgi:hypothetical protein
MAQKEFRETLAEHWDEIVEAGSAPPQPPGDTWLTRKDLSKREKVPEATLAHWASQGRGPKCARFGRHVRYRLSDVIAWENEQFGGVAMNSIGAPPQR